jgi:hypothetical protein
MFPFIFSGGDKGRGTLDLLLSTTYCRSQMYLSRQLAQLHPELTMPMFSGKFAVSKLSISQCADAVKLFAVNEVGTDKEFINNSNKTSVNAHSCACLR